MPIKDRSTFAEECVLQGAFLGVHPHYLMATAALRSNINDNTVNGQIGPYRVQQTFWDANSVAADLEVILNPAHINIWRLQVLFASVTAYRAQNRLMDAKGQFPSVVELYCEQWSVTGTQALATSLQAKLDETKDLIEQASNKLLGPVQTPSIAAPTDPASPQSPDSNVAAADKSQQLFLLKAQPAMEKLIDDFDLSDFQAAGILGNIGLECDGFHLMQEVNPIGGGRGGFGWCQWTGDRRTQFEAFCTAQGLDPTSDAANYGYLNRELHTTEKASIDALKQTTNLVQAVHVFEQKFERAAQGLEHFDRREMWGKLALANFKRKLPAAVTKLLDPDLQYKVIASAVSGTANFWAVEQFTENGGQFLIAQTAGQDAKIVSRDTAVFPIKLDLIPNPIPQAIANALSANVEPPGKLPPKISVPAASSDQDAAQRVFAQAKACDETLITRNVPGTSQGQLACAWAVNEVVRRALGKPIGGGLSTADMGKVLNDDHTKVDENQITAGMIVISPTTGGNVGHVGIVGEIKSSLSDTTIYSNSSSRGVFSHKYTLGTWKNYYKVRKGLPVLFFAIQAKILSANSL